MVGKTVNLSANEVLEHLNITLPASWSAEANEIDTVCFDHKDVGLGYYRDWETVL